MNIKTSAISLLTALVIMLTGCAKTEDPSQGSSDSSSAVTESAQGGEDSSTAGDGTSAGDSANSTTESTSEDDMTLSEKTFAANEENVKLIGRTAEYENIRWLGLSASGVEFTFTGTSASFTLVGDSMYSNPEKTPRFAVYINGERTFDDVVDAPEKTVEVFSADEAVETTVKFLKISEAQESTMGIKSINVTSIGGLTPTAEKALKIEFIGDSITCGYGVDDPDRNHHFKTTTEDATKAYAFKTAMALDADYSLVSYSGNGIISGYTDNGTKQESQRVPDVYDKVGKSWGNWNEFNIQDVDWDFSKFQPQYVVINLGTNDGSYTGSDKDRVLEYAEGYKEFLKVVREKNPDAHIVCALGVMGSGLYKNGIQRAVTEYTEETGDSNVSTLLMTQQDGNTNGYAADWHPTEASQDIAANEMTEYIKSLIG